MRGRLFRAAAVGLVGEAGFVRFLAARDDVPVTTLDPSRAEEVAHLRLTFPATVVGGTHVVMQERALRECLASGGGGC